MPARRITQDELELARLGMGIARIQMHSVAATLAAVGDYKVSDLLKQFDANMGELCKQIFNGEVKADG